jgi:oligopeptide/dipeptide ABC transporter ATP-binding protein
VTVLDQAAESGETPLLEVRHVKKYFPIRSGILQREVARVHAVDDVSFAVREGETLGLVGESGCGKSTLGRTIVRLLEPTDGEIIFQGRQIGHLGTRQLRPLRREMQMVFQDPYASLNPRKRVGTIVSDPMRIHNLGSRSEQKRRVGEILETVGLSPEHYNRFPHEFSGGQRQRIGIARALALRPKLIVADEPVSALDVSIQSQMPYTEALLSAVPIPDPDLAAKRERIVLEGDVPSPINPPSGCRFHPRCRYATDVCRQLEPPLVDYGNGHLAACHHPLNVDQATLQQVGVAEQHTPAAADSGALPQDTSGSSNPAATPDTHSR